MNPNRETRIASAVAAASLAMILSGCAAGSTAAPAANAAEAAAEPAVVMTHNGAHDATVQLFAEMRALWAQHMEWTYAAVVAFAAESPGLSATLDRLLANQEHIGDAVKPFYGAQAARQLTALLQTHIKEAVPVLVAARDGDQAALDAAVADWYANAEEIGDFLSTANPAWPQGEMRQMMRMHITQTITYAAEQLQGKYADSIRHYDEAERHMMEMADMLSAGLVEQFPARFH